MNGVVRRMVSPPLPGGWRFVDASMGTSEIVARYHDAARGVRAQMTLTKRDDAAGALHTAQFTARFRASSGSNETRALFASLVHAVREHEHEFHWSAEDPPLTRFRELAALGRYREALDVAEAAPRTGPLLIASAWLRATLQDGEHAMADARAALTFGRSVATELRAATIFARFGDEQQALDILRSIRAPESMLPEIAALLVQLGEFSSAIELYERIDSPAARLAIGNVRAWFGDAEAAERSARGLADAWCLSGIARALRGEHEAALADLDRAVALSPEDATAAVWRAEMLLRLHRVDAARDEIFRAGNLTDDRTSHVPALILRALILERLDIHEPIEFVLERAMETLSPGAPRDWERALRALRGNRTATITHVRGGNLERIQLPRAMRVASKHALWRFVATASVEEAERDFDRVQAEFPSAPEPHNYRGELFLYVGDAASARRCFERALSMNPQSRWAFIGLAAVALLEDRPKDALDVLERGTRAAGPGPTAYVYRGEAHLRLGHFDEARADLTHAVKLNPTRIGAWVNLARLHAQLGEAAALDEVMSVLRSRASSLVADATEACGDVDVTRLLDEMLVMLRGNRASSCVTYFTRGGRLRSIPPDHRGSTR